MANAITNRFKRELFDGNVDLSANDYWAVSLIDARYVSAAADTLNNYNSWTEISDSEVTGSGYTAGGKNLSGVTLNENDTTNKVVWDAEDLTWSSSTITARGAAIYDPNNDLLVALFDFTEDKSSTAGDFTISWSSNGIIDVT